MKQRSSIHFKILFPIIASLTICVMSYSAYYVYSVEQNARARFQTSSEVFVQTAVDNINHYFDTYVYAAKSVYANRTLLFTLTNNATGDISSPGEKQSEVLNYLRSVCYAVPSAVQVYLALPESGVSFLYVPSEFVFSFCESHELPPEEASLESYLDIYLQETHAKTTYGHTITFSKTSHNQEPVFTLWIPIANIPYSLENKCYIAIDISTSFLVNNCTPDANNSEQTFLLKDNGYIMASNVPDAIGQLIQDVLPTFSWQGQDVMTWNSNLVVSAAFDSRLISGTFVKITPFSVIFDSATLNAIGLLVVFAVLLLALLVFNVLSISRYTKPLVRLTACMNEIARSKTWQANSEVAKAVNYNKDDEIGTLIKTFDDMLTTLKAVRIRQYELELASTNATLKMLQAQINPHFIYNMLQYFATSALRVSDSTLYAELSSFGQMLHYSMVIEPSLASVCQEIGYIQRYVALQQARFQHAEAAGITVSPQAGKIRIPKMSIVPLVENSLKHGKLYRQPGSILQISAIVSGQKLVVTVEDNGVSIPAEKAEALQQELLTLRGSLLDHTRTSGPCDPLSVDSAGSSIGIRNVFTRLLLHFGDCALRIYPNRLGGTTVTFTVPLSEAPSSQPSLSPVEVSL